jgi:hypothetical protein
VAALAAACSGRRILRVRHALADHPAFGLDALASTAETLPAAWIRGMPADAPVLRPEGYHADAVDLPAERLVRELGTNGCAVRLYHLEHVAPYRDVVAAALDEAEAAIATVEGGFTIRNGSAFLGGPGAVTPVHPDRHHNLLLQVCGTKDVGVGWFRDPLENQRQTERTFAQFGEGPSAMPDDMEVHQLGPGDGLYIPPYAFHWVRVTGDTPSVALSCAWSTRRSERDALVHAFNLRLRERTPLRPRPPRDSAARDRAKAAVMGARFRRLGIPAR